MLDALATKLINTHLIVLIQIDSLPSKNQRLKKHLEGKTSYNLLLFMQPLFNFFPCRAYELL